MEVGSSIAIASSFSAAFERAMDRMSISIQPARSGEALRSMQMFV
jgi:hypothetical protein